MSVGVGTSDAETCPPVAQPAALWRPLPPAKRAPLPAFRSRWQKSTLTFGPVGRISWTAGLVTVLLFALVYGGPGGLPFDLMWASLVMPLCLRDIWAVGTTHLPDAPQTGPPAPPLTGSVSLSDFVAGQVVHYDAFRR